MENLPKLQPPPPPPPPPHLPSDTDQRNIAATQHQQPLIPYHHYHHQQNINNPYYPPNPKPPGAADPDGIPHVSSYDAQGYAAAYAATIAPPLPTSLLGLVPQLNPLPIVGLQELNYHNLKKKAPKVVKSIYCPVCKIDCNSQEVLNNHKLGRKHKRNLEKLTESLNTESSQPMPLLPSTGTKSGNKTDQKKKKSTPTSAEDLATKTRKVIEGGAAQEAVKVCTICNVVCNSDVVFNFHLAGQKHAAMVKKLGAVAS